MNISGKHILITGASSGIGRACALAFAAEGCELFLTARRHGRLNELAEEVQQKSETRSMVQTLDVRSGKEISALRERIEDFAPDILVNNAGLARGLASIQEGDPADWEEMIDTNIRGLLLMSRAVLPGMISRGSGHIINIGSIAGHESYPGGAVYCGTKHAVAAINRAMGMDTLGTGVRISSVDPGMVETEFSLVRFHGDRERAEKTYEGFQPLSAEAVAEAVLFCARRPAHVNIREMILMPSDQASAAHSFRRGKIGK